MFDGDMLQALVLFTALALAFTAWARGLSRFYVTAPIVFVLAGGVVAAAAGSPTAETTVQIKSVAEITLALTLFHDAAQVRPRQIGAERGLVTRLLLIGLPITILAGYASARLMFPAMPAMVCLLLAASLAPTDASLGAATVLNPVIPVRIRRVLNVESGLNDGLATPVVLFAIAAIAGAEGLAPRSSLAEAALEIAVGVIAGVAVGAGGGLLLGWSRRRDVSSRHSRAIGVLLLPILAYSLADLIGGNAFVAAFVSGSAFAGAAAWPDQEETALDLTEMLSGLLAFAVWFVFGLAALPLVGSALGWPEVAFAVLSLTVLRMLPVAAALIGTGLRAPSVSFIGWFGPRGMASIVFALIAVESLDATDDLRHAIAVIALTVLLSVLAHGLSADVLAARYGRWVTRTSPKAETAGSLEPRARKALYAHHTA